MEAGPVVTLVVGPPMESNCCESKVRMGSSEDVNDPPPEGKFGKNRHVVGCSRRDGRLFVCPATFDLFIPVTGGGGGCVSICGLAQAGSKFELRMITLRGGSGKITSDSDNEDA